MLKPAQPATCKSLLVGVSFFISLCLGTPPASALHNTSTAVHSPEKSMKPATQSKPAVSKPADISDRISNMVIDGSVQRDGSLEVKEQLTFLLLSPNRHGITRSFPNVYHMSGFRHPIKVAVYSVTEGTGHRADFDVVQDGGRTTINIGNGGKILHGKYTYTLRYRLDGLITEHDGQPKSLYWHATGKWPFPIDSAEIALHTPPGSAASKCSAFLSNNSEDIPVSFDGSLADCSTRAISPDSGIILSANIDSKAVELSHPSLRNIKPNLAANSRGWFRQNYLIVLIGIGLLIVLFRAGFGGCSCRCGYVCKCSCVCGDNCRCRRSVADSYDSYDRYGYRRSAWGSSYDGGSYNIGSSWSDSSWGGADSWSGSDTSFGSSDTSFGDSSSGSDDSGGGSSW